MWTAVLPRDLRATARATFIPPATLRLDSLSASAHAVADLAGTLEISWAPRLAFTGQIAARRLDGTLDELPKAGQRFDQTRD